MINLSHNAAQASTRSKMAAGSNGRKSKWDIPSSEANGSSEGGGSSSASDAARERAAKLNAMLAAKGKLAKATTPAPLVPAPPPGITSAPKLLTSRKESQFSDQDLFTAEVEINDSPSRVILCKGLTQDELNRCSGAAVSTRGKYLRQNEKVTAEENGEKPLYLCIQGTTQAKVDLAVKRIREIMAGADIYGKFSGSYTPPAAQPPVTSSFHPQPLIPSQNLPHGMHYVQEKIFVGLDHTPPEFNLKEKLLGPAGSYFQHIAMETGAKVQLRGRGSGFIEPTSGKEAFEALYVYISHSKVEGLSAAKKLAESLIQTVHTEFKAFEQANTARNFYADPFQRGYPPAPHPPAPGYQTPYGYLPPARYPLPSGAPPPPGGYRVAPPPSHYYNQPVQPHHGPSTHVPPVPVPFRDPPPPGQGFPYPPGTAVSPVSGPGPYPQYSGHASYPGPPPLNPCSTAASQGPPEYYNQMNQPPQPVLVRPPAPQTSQPRPMLPPAPAPPPSVVPVPRPRHDPSKRRFTEKAPVKSSGLEPPLGTGPSDKSSVSPIPHRPNLGSYPLQDKDGQQSRHDEKTHADSCMPPPVAAPLKVKPKLKNDLMPPPSVKNQMPPPPVPMSSRLQGKRQSSAKLPPNWEVKKVKAEEKDTTVSALAPLVAYGDGDSSSDEDEVQSPLSKGDGVASGDKGTGNQQGSLPFWAVRRP